MITFVISWKVGGNSEWIIFSHNWRRLIMIETLCAKSDRWIGLQAHLSALCDIVFCVLCRLVRIGAGNSGSNSGVCGDIGQMLWKCLRAGSDLPRWRCPSHSRRTCDGRNGSANEHVRHPGKDWGPKPTGQARGWPIRSASSSRKRRQEYEHSTTDQRHEAARFATGHQGTNANTQLYVIP